MGLVELLIVLLVIGYFTGWLGFGGLGLGNGWHMLVVLILVLIVYRVLTRGRA